MKTIEEAAKERAKENYFFESSHNFTIDMNTFKLGIEFAQRWIPVTEELPKHREMVLIMWNEKGREIKATGSWHLNGEDNYWASGGATQLAITHWRPIERL